MEPKKPQQQPGQQQQQRQPGQQQRERQADPRQPGKGTQFEREQRDKQTSSH